MQGLIEHILDLHLIELLHLKPLEHYDLTKLVPHTAQHLGQPVNHSHLKYEPFHLYWNEHLKQEFSSSLFHKRSMKADD